MKSETVSIPGESAVSVLSTAPRHTLMYSTSDILSTTTTTTANEECPPDDGGSSDPVEGMAAAAAVHFASVDFIVPMTALFLLDVVIIIGNGMVAAAVLTQRKLRTVTNTFIVSLAMSDLFLGLVVLPFSSANEVLGYWPFGPLWCSAWLAVDVWLCTASILNLCVISLDRFLAIKCPFKYPSLMSPLRAKVSIAVVWTLSLAICIPPLLGWKDRRLEEAQMTPSPAQNKSQIPDDGPMAVDSESGSRDALITEGGSSLLIPVTRPDDLPGSLQQQGDCYLQNIRLPVCDLASEPGYIIYSACGSFWIPMLIMISFYVRIYQTAAKATKSLRRGIVTRRSTSVGLAASSSDTSVNLRVHRGGTSVHLLSTDSPHGNSSVSSPSIDAFDRGIGGVHRFRTQLSNIRGSPEASTASPPEPLELNTIPPSIESLLRTACSPVYEELPRYRSTTTASHHSINNLVMAGGGGGGGGRKGLIQIRSQLRRFNREKKAAKTVGIIVGCFTICWSPFFTVYFLGAFCADCTPAWVFTIFFWLGYCNSAINPIIYGLCSKDFRSAFKRLFRCSRHQRSRTQLARLISGLHHHNSTHGATHLDYLTVVYR